MTSLLRFCMPCDNLILLVGSNPLPNYLTAMMMRPKQVILFYTEETQGVAENLGTILKEKIENVSIKPRQFANATDCKSIRDNFASELENLPNEDSSFHLDYTGGTKAMAAHSRWCMWMKLNENSDACCSYLDESSGELKFDDGCKYPLDSSLIQLDLDTLLRLHEIERENKKSGFELMSSCDFDKMAKKVLEDDELELANKLNSIHRISPDKTRSFTEAKEKKNVYDATALGLDGIPDTIPGENWKKDKFEAWTKFLRGDWLEVLVEKLVKDLFAQESKDSKDSSVHIHRNIQCKNKAGRPFQIDVLVIRGHRLYVISCTMCYDIQGCKSKVIEASVRAAQMGGGLARCCLVSFLHGEEGKKIRLDEVQNDVADIWDSATTPKVFGLDHLRAWVGIGDSDPDLTTLKDWLYK